MMGILARSASSRLSGLRSTASRIRLHDTRCSSRTVPLAATLRIVLLYYLSKGVVDSECSIGIAELNGSSDSF